MNSTTPELSISLLGPFRAELDGQPLLGFRTAKVRALLAFLALESHRPWSRSKLADLLWPDLPEKSAQNNLRNAISNLRRVLDDPHRNPPFLLVTQDTLQYNQKTATWLDVEAFMSSVTTAVESSQNVLLKDDLDRLEQALALYRGEFMEGFSIASAPFEEWVLQKSIQIQQKALQALCLLVPGSAMLGELDRALIHARRWIEIEPWDETAQRHMLNIFWQKDQRYLALAHYEAFRQQLASELNTEPEPATTQLYYQIRSGPPGPEPSVVQSYIDTGVAQLPGFLREAELPKHERTLFVARQQELDRLESELEKTIRGDGQILFVIGDPGSGKTALLAEFSRKAMLKHPDLIAVRGQCNAYIGSADPYFPFLEILQMLTGDIEARLAGGAITAEHARRIWGVLPKMINTVLEQGPDLINTLIPGRDLLATAQRVHGVKSEALIFLQSQLKQSVQSPARPRLQQVALFDQFSKVLSSLSRHSTLLLILDDLQWIDGDSVNLLFHLGRRLAGSRILLVGAYRPEDVALGRHGERHPLEGVVNELQTTQGDIHIDLMKIEGIDFIEALLDSEPNRLGADFRSILHRHTSGHPLFTIELLRGMQLRGDIRRNPRGQWVAGPGLDWDQLPVRVEAVIAERIAHLPGAYQEMLSVASVEGEQFTAEILAEIAGKEQTEVIQILSQEISKNHRLIVAQSRTLFHGQTLSQYRFRHFLYQKYLYQKLDPVEKARLHEKIGLAQESIYLKDPGNYPEIALQLAHHFDQAGLVEKATRYYTESGKYAVRLSANREAITHFDRALDLVMSLSRSEERDWQALSLHLSLGPPLTATRGWAAPELEQNYRQTEVFCNHMADDPRLVPALWLLSVYRLGRSEHAAVDKLVTRFSALAQKIGDPRLLSLADLQVSQLYQGKLAEAREILTRVSLSRDLEMQRSLAYQFGMSPSIVGLAYLGNCLWLMGFPEQASQSSQEACEFADEVNVPITTCYALSRYCWQSAFCGDVEMTRLQAKKLLQIAQEHEFRSFELAALFFLHWIKAQTGPPTSQDLEKMAQAMDEYQRLGTVLNRTTFLILLAEACRNAGQVGRGLAALDESIALGGSTGERWFEAEAYRLKGELAVKLSANAERQDLHLSEAEKCFQMAQQIARRQGAKMLELRAITFQCRLWHRLGKGENGRQSLKQIIEWFSEGWESQDLSQAKAVLNEIDQ